MYPVLECDRMGRLALLCFTAMVSGRLLCSQSKIGHTPHVAHTALASAATGTSLVLDTSPANPVFGNPVILTATVTPVETQGGVAFYDDSTLLGHASLNGGKASLAVRLGTGIRHLRGRYSGPSS